MTYSSKGEPSGTTIEQMIPTTMPATSDTRIHVVRLDDFFGFWLFSSVVASSDVMAALPPLQYYKVAAIGPTVTD
jgi:hypothetical protein